MDLQKLETLANLKEKGLITQEEYEMQKQRLMDETPQAASQPAKEGKKKFSPIKCAIAVVVGLLYALMLGVMGAAEEEIYGGERSDTHVGMCFSLGLFFYAISLGIKYGLNYRSSQRTAEQKKADRINLALLLGLGPIGLGIVTYRLLSKYETDKPFSECVKDFKNQFPQMIKPFLQCFKVCATEKYRLFEGRSSREEGLRYMIVFIPILLVLLIINIEALVSIYGIVLLSPTIALLTRRLHDFNWPAWWLIPFIFPVILNFTPTTADILNILCMLMSFISFIIFLYIIFAEGDEKPNKYGEIPDTKY